TFRIMRKELREERHKCFGGLGRKFNLTVNRQVSREAFQTFEGDLLRSLIPRTECLRERLNSRFGATMRLRKRSKRPRADFRLLRCRKSRHTVHRFIVVKPKLVEEFQYLRTHASRSLHGVDEKRSPLARVFEKSFLGFS